MGNTSDCSVHEEVVLNDETLQFHWDQVGRHLPLARTAELRNGAEPTSAVERAFVHTRKLMLARGLLKTY